MDNITALLCSYYNRTKLFFDEEKGETCCEDHETNLFLFYSRRDISVHSKNTAYSREDGH